MKAAVAAAANRLARRILTTFLQKAGTALGPADPMCEWRGSRLPTRPPPRSIALSPSRSLAVLAGSAGAAGMPNNRDTIVRRCDEKSARARLSHNLLPRRYEEVSSTDQIGQSVSGARSRSTFDRFRRAAVPQNRVPSHVGFWHRIKHLVHFLTIWNEQGCRLDRCVRRTSQGLNPDICACFTKSSVLSIYLGV